MIHAENERFRVSMLRGMACPLTSYAKGCAVHSLNIIHG